MQSLDQQDNNIDDTQNDEASAVLADDKVRANIFDLRHTSKKARPIKLYLLIGTVGLVFILTVLGIWLFAASKMTVSSSPVDESTVIADATLSAPPAQDDAMTQYRQEKLRKIEEERRKQVEEQAKKQQEAQMAAAAQNPPGSTNSSNRVSPGGAPPAQQVSGATQRKLGGGVMLQANDSGASSAGSDGNAVADNGRRSLPDRAGQTGAARPSPSEPSSRGLGNAGMASSRGSLNDLEGPDFAPAKATLAPPRKYLLAHGTYARCALYPEIITEHPGIIDCRLTEPLYSADGSTVIAEPGDRLSGVQKVQMAAGQARVFTSWTELETASGARAQLASLGAGPMGASGTEAWIDNHYMQRYGGAIMLSFIQDALAAASNSTQDSDSEYTVHNTEQNVENMAEKALDNSINIPPTAYILPGTVINVIVARDIDFSSVFENH